MKASIAIFTWFLSGLLMTPWIAHGHGQVSQWIPPHPEFFVVVIVLIVGVVVMAKIAGWFDRLIAGASIIFHSFPTLVLVFEPGFYWMFFPSGIFVLLCSPWYPLLLFPLIRWLPVAPIHLLLPLRGLGVCFFLIGTGTFMAALIQLLTGRGLVSTGLYSVVRHPQYLGIMLATLGLTIMGEYLNPMSVMTWITLVFAYVYLAGKEEATLQDRFGEEFLSYSRRVPFLLPGGTPEPLLPSKRIERYVRNWLIIIAVVAVIFAIILRVPL